MFIRIVRPKQAQKGDAAIEWRDKVSQAVQYEDRIIEADKFLDDGSILYACQLEADGTFTVLKDTGITAKMGHTFAGWPISAPMGKVTDPDPLAPKVAAPVEGEAAPVKKT